MKKANSYFYISLIFAIWFIVSCALWTYLINVFISFPFGIASFFLARAGQKIEGRTTRFKVVDVILLFGLGISIVVLIGLLLYN